MVTTPNYSMSNFAGVDLNNTFAVDLSSGYDNPPHALLEETVAINGNVFIFVFCAAAVNVNDCVYIDKDGNAQQMTTAIGATLLGRVGFAQIAIPAGNYAWVALNGTINVNVLTATAIAVPLYTTATAGVLSSAVTTLITGIYLTTANVSGSTTNRPALASWPRLLQ